MAGPFASGKLPSTAAPAVPDDRFLADTIQEILATAEKRGVRSIAVPAAYLEEMPPERVAKIMLTTALAFIRSGTSIHHVIFCMSDTASYSVFQKELERITS